MKQRIALFVSLFVVAPFLPGAGCLNLNEVDAERLAAAYGVLYQKCIANDTDLFYRVEKDLLDAQAGDGALEKSIEDIIQASVDDPKIDADSDKYATCLAFLESDPPCEDASDLNDMLEEAGCNGMFVGTVEEGETCVDQQCVPGAYCEVDGEAEDDCGTCVVAAKKGEDCTEKACDDGLYCQQDAEDDTLLTCEDTPDEEPEASVGDECVSLYDCYPALACGAEGTCVAAEVVGNGDACEPYGAMGGTRFCEGSIVSHTLFCDVDVGSGATEGTCKTSPSTGEACAGPAGTTCNALESVCNVSNSTCEARAGLGDSCVQEGSDAEPSASELCAVNAFCDDSTNLCSTGQSFEAPICAEATEDSDA
jgi:hypothetical protein